MLLGGLRDGCGSVGGVDVTSDAVGCLGICIGHSGNRCCELGWLHLFRSVERLFEFWRERGLAVFAKACIVDSLPVSEVVCVDSVLPVPDPGCVKQLKGDVFGFVWNRGDGVGRDAVVGGRGDGGVGVVGVGSGLGALGAAWCGVLVGRACVVGRVGDGYLGVLGVDVGCVLNVSETGGSGFKIISKLPNIYKEVLSSFNDCKKKH